MPSLDKTPEQLENELLRRELGEQWALNHAEHCRNDYPHSGICTWPLPSLLKLSDLPAWLGIPLGMAFIKEGGEVTDHMRERARQLAREREGIVL